MSSTPSDPHREDPDTLPRRLERPARCWRFQAENDRTTPGFVLDQRSRDRTADFLLGIDQPADRPVRQPPLLEKAHRLQEHGDARLHVVDPQAEGEVSFDPEGTVLHRPDRPDGVEMGEHEQWLS
jgi:hypothetical protein